jgi:hypothetical protein
MKLLKTPFVAATLVLALSACLDTKTTSTDAGETGSTLQRQEVIQEQVIRETKNVSYTGTVKPAGMSIYSEGTHRLVLKDSKFILLESTVKDLNGYVGEEVQVLGAIRPTEETDAMIMRVDEISLIEKEEDENMEEGEEPEEVATTEDDEEPTEEPAEEVVEEPTEEVIPEPKVAEKKSPAYLKRVEKMASETFTAENWTQEYCTAHIGFCVPVHRNWWYKSFGATSSSYWHLEMNPESIENLGDGPIVVLLNGESIDALGIEEGAIQAEGSDIVGYRSWTNGRHFEIRADASLRSAIEYITEKLRTNE